MVVTGGNLDVIVNDAMGRNFGNFKGVRQGHPLPPFLFDMVANCLQRMVQLAQETGELVGLIPHLIDRGLLYYNMQMIPLCLYKIIWII